MQNGHIGNARFCATLCELASAPTVLQHLLAINRRLFLIVGVQQQTT
jgi:hypothetical protein